MPEFIDNVKQFVEEKPWIAVGAVIGGAAIVAFALSRREEPEPVDENGVPVTSSLSDLAPSPLPILINQTPLTAPSPQTVPEQSLVSILRDGRTINVTGGPPGLCPPGYVSAQQPGQPPRCTLVNPANKRPGQRQVFFPGRGEGEFI